MEKESWIIINFYKKKRIKSQNCKIKFEILKEYNNPDNYNYDFKLTN